MPGSTTINRLLKLAKSEAERLKGKPGPATSPAVKSAIEVVLAMLATKSGNDRKIVELAETVRAALK